MNKILIGLLMLSAVLFAQSDVQSIQQAMDNLESTTKSIIIIPSMIFLGLGGLIFCIGGVMFLMGQFYKEGNIKIKTAGSLTMIVSLGFLGIGLLGIIIYFLMPFFIDYLMMG